MTRYLHQIFWLCLLGTLHPTLSMAQTPATDSLPYAQIPDYPATYAPGSVAARMVDAIGFRYYWATEGLRDEDLAYRPSPEARSMSETLDHLYGLSLMIVRATRGEAHARPEQRGEGAFSDQRKATLLNIQEAADRLRSADAEALAEMDVRFQGSDRSFPFWNALNGPIADALTHIGQVVSFRRTSGNPQPAGVSVFTGTKRN